MGGRGRKCRLGLRGDQGKSGRVYLRKTQRFHDSLVKWEHGDSTFMVENEAFEVENEAF